MLLLIYASIDAQPDYCEREGSSLTPEPSVRFEILLSGSNCCVYTHDSIQMIYEMEHGRIPIGNRFSFMLSPSS
jgi:hypothetical protein